MVTTFLVSLAGGLLVALATADAASLAWRFVRIVAAIAFALTCLVIAWRILQRTTGGNMEGWLTATAAVCGVGAMAVLFMAPTAGRAPGLLRWVSLGAGSSGLASACVASLAGHEAGLPQWSVIALIVVGQILGGLLLGSITVAWLLGHAYLTATTMTIAPLRHFSRLISVAVAARIAFVPVGIGVVWLTNHSDQAGIWTKLASSWLILVLRVGVGLGGVAVFAYMVADCVRLRATQSATGILYFGSLFAYIGELAGQHLTEQFGWPV